MTADQQENIHILQAERDKLQEKLDGIDGQIKAIKTEARAEVLKAVQQQAVLFNFTPGEILGLAEKKSRPSKSPDALDSKTPLYRNEAGETWGGGKGRLPKWVKALKESGGDIQKYRIAPQ